MSQEYTNYIVEHRLNVKKAYYWLWAHGILDYLHGNYPPNPTQIAEHDMSKYQPDEYGAYDAYFYGNKTEKVEKEFNYAWLYHIHRNPHHWQYWILRHDDEPEEVLEMPEPYVIEMICDWWSFSFKTGNLYEIFDWYEKHKGMTLHPNTRKLVEDILDKIKKVLDKVKVLDEEKNNENK